MTNAELISSELERMNRDREEEARSSVRGIIQEIVKQQTIIRQAQDRIQKCREMLSQVSVEPVNAKDVLG